MMFYCFVNKKGFINAFSLFLLQFIAIISLLYVHRYTTLLTQQHLQQQGYLCELYIFHHLTQHADIEQKPSQKDENEEQTETDQDEGEDMINEEPKKELLQFKDCNIELEYDEHEVTAFYQNQEQQAALHIILDDTTKEIMDIAYEKGFLP